MSTPHSMFVSCGRLHAHGLMRAERTPIGSARPLRGTCCLAAFLFREFRSDDTAVRFAGAANSGTPQGTIIMAGLRKSFFIKARDFVHAGEASIRVQSLLKSIHLDPRLTRRIAVCSYEGEMNVVMHGEDGLLSVAIDPDRLVLEVDRPGSRDRRRRTRHAARLFDRVR